MSTPPPPPRFHASKLCRQQRYFWSSHLFFLLCMCCGFQKSTAQKNPPSTLGTLPSEEIDALKQIASKLKIGFWDFNVNPCSGLNRWLDNTTSIKVVSNLTCSDPDGNNTRHVISILLKSQNLTGVLPTEFANLKSLIQLDLTRNYISGSIPPEWGSLPRLFNLSLGGNRISGKIPEEIGNIITLNSLVLENNLLDGPIPDVFGRLAKLKRLILSGNDFTNELPISMGNLTNLVDLRIDGSGISGKIPSFIGNLKNLGRFHMHGTSLRGPFPSEFSALVELFQLLVSDLKLVSFPPLQNMSKMSSLILRNCSLSDDLPDYIGKMTKLSFLDLSFNDFTGNIPTSYEALDLSIKNMYLTSNNLSGPIPKWIVRSEKIIDLSYNNFEESSEPTRCDQQGASRVNVFASRSSSKNSSIDPCLRKNFPCSRSRLRNHNLFINCGGDNVTIGGNQFDWDKAPFGASTFFMFPNKKWAFSSTGNYFFKESRGDYITENKTILNMSNQKLYKEARLSPNSLRYYGLCLRKGNYNVSLHFAEIIFINDQSFHSSGRRFFDVSIQGQPVLEDFNIATTANGTDSLSVIKNFTATVDDTGTLEIGFRWSGKGSNSLIEKGVYGPLISAISVTSSKGPSVDSRPKKRLSVRYIVAIPISLFTMVLFILLLLYIRKKFQTNNDYVLGNAGLPTTQFNLKLILSVTRNFSHENKIGEGGFGPVFKGILSDGTLIAVKKLSSWSSQGNREFINEIGLISALRHPNLVKILGCCIEGDQLLLVYEYMENNSVWRVLLGSERNSFKLDWRTRCNIVLGIAKGLTYLHEESRFKIIHRDIKATNVLLDKDFNAKISDFGLAKLYDERGTHISTRIAGTRGYMAPEYAMWGHLSDKADVYSFGIVLLEVVSGKSNIIELPDKEILYLPDWARDLKESGNLLQFVDENLGSEYSQEEAIEMIKLGLLCVNSTSSTRPRMSEVVSALEGGDCVHGRPSVKQACLSIIDEKSHSQASTSILQSYIEDLPR